MHHKTKLSILCEDIVLSYSSQCIQMDEITVMTNQDMDYKFPFSDVGVDEFNSDIHYSEEKDILYDKCQSCNLQSLNYEKCIAFDCENRNEQSMCSDINLNCEYYTPTKFNDQKNLTHGLSIICFNCRSLKANFNQTKYYLKY